MEETLTRQQAFMAIQIIDKMLRVTATRMAPDEYAAFHLGKASADLHKAMEILCDDTGVQG